MVVKIVVVKMVVLFILVFFNSLGFMVKIYDMVKKVVRLLINLWWIEVWFLCKWNNCFRIMIYF